MTDLTGIGIIIVIIEVLVGIAELGTKQAETWEEMPPMFLTSAEKKEGRNEVLNYIEKINGTLSFEL